MNKSILLIFSLFFFSCISIESDIFLQENNIGKGLLKFSFDKKIIDFLAYFNKTNGESILNVLETNWRDKNKEYLDSDIYINVYKQEHIKKGNNYNVIVYFNFKDIKKLDAFYKAIFGKDYHIKFNKNLYKNLNTKYDFSFLFNQNIIKDSSELNFFIKKIRFIDNITVESKIKESFALNPIKKIKISTDNNKTKLSFLLSSLTSNLKDDKFNWNVVW